MTVSPAQPVRTSRTTPTRGREAGPRVRVVGVAAVTAAVTAAAMMSVGSGGGRAAGGGGHDQPAAIGALSIAVGAVGFATCATLVGCLVGAPLIATAGIGIAATGAAGVGAYNYYQTQ